MRLSAIVSMIVLFCCVAIAGPASFGPAVKLNSPSPAVKVG